MKALLFGSSAISSWFSDLLITTARVFIGLAMAFAHGVGKLPPSEKFLSGVEELGFPMPLLFGWSAGLAECVGGLFLAIGFMTRPSALFIGLTMAVAGFGRHALDPFQKKELAFLYLAAALIFVALGGGRFSLDRLLRKGK